MIKGFEDLTTPFLVVDRAIALRNADRMLEKARKNGVTIRPHVKTHKTIEGARLQLGAEFGPITVSTIAEAEDFADHGFEDITYAVPIAPAKFDRCAALAGRIERLNLLVDDVSSIDALESFAKSNTVTFDVFLKIDCGYHRAGVKPDDPAAVVLARSIHESDVLSFRGLLTHAGHAYHARSREEIVPIAVAEQRSLTSFASQLSGEGITVPCRSVGSTPTMSVAKTIDADEMRPGNYLFFDAFQAAIGSCSLDDVAASVVASVIGRYPGRREAVIDCGSLGLSKDVGPTQIDPEAGYGVVTGLDGERLTARLVSLSQEHGILRFGDKNEIPSIGDLVRIIPNHSCLTAAMYESYIVVENTEVVDEWHPSRGW